MRHYTETESMAPLEEEEALLTVAQLVDLEWFNGTTPVGALEERCEPVLAGGHLGGFAAMLEVGAVVQPSFLE